MFWTSDELREEEWSVSAKLIGGMVLNPFSLANDRDDRLVDWFLERATDGASGRVREWSAQPEYNAGRAGRNDWRVCFDGWRVVIECKLGDCIEPRKDCLRYLDDLRRESDDKRCAMVVVATDAELALLSRVCANSCDAAPRVREALRMGQLRLVAWHEVVEETIARVPKQAGRTISSWAATVERAGATMMPDQRVSGADAERLIINGTASDGPTGGIQRDARGVRRSTALSVDQVCAVRSSPRWVCDLLREVERRFENRGLLRMGSGWMNICKKKSKLTLFPWCDGVAILITHPDAQRQQPSDLRPLEDLAVNIHVPEMPQWFPRPGAIGIEFRQPPGQEECMQLIERLLRSVV